MGITEVIPNSLKVIKQLVILNGYSLITGVIGIPLVIPFRIGECSIFLIGNLHPLFRKRGIPELQRNPLRHENVSPLLEAPLESSF